MRLLVFMMMIFFVSDLLALSGESLFVKRRVRISDQNHMRVYDRDSGMIEEERSVDVTHPISIEQIMQINAETEYLERLMIAADLKFEAARSLKKDKKILRDAYRLFAGMSPDRDPVDHFERYEFSFGLKTMAQAYEHLMRDSVEKRMRELWEINRSA